MTLKKEWHEIFIEKLRGNPNVTAAARSAGISRQHVYLVRESDSEFAKAWDDALGQSVEQAEGELYRRAVKGVLEPVFYEGKKVATIRKYSDTLLIFLLKAHKPERYRDQLKLSGDGPEGEILIKIDK